MTWVIGLWMGAFFFIAGSTLLTIWARKDTWVRNVAIWLFLMSIPMFLGTITETLGWHRPYALTWDLTPGDHRVLAAKMVFEEGIYLYLDDPKREPRPLVLPWDNDMANEIQKQMDEAAPDSNGQFMMRYEPSFDTHAPQFHPLPQPPAMPPKPRLEPAPHLEGSDA